MSEATTWEPVALLDGPIELAGAVGLESGPGRFTPWRLPRHDADLYHPGLLGLARCPAGVRLRWRSDARAVAFEIELEDVPGFEETAPFAIADLLVDGVPVETPLSGGGRFEVTDLGDAMKDFELWLPSFPPINLRSIELPRRASLEPPSPDERPSWVVYGSSITHAIGIPPTEAWPAVAARLLARNHLSLGLAGNAQLDPHVARAIAELPAATITLKLGINLHNAASMRERTFAPAVHGFLATIRDRRPDVPIIVVSPVASPIREQSARSPVPLADDADFFIEGDLTLEQIRVILADVVNIWRRRGDGALHYLDGLELLGLGDVDRLPDGLHPDAEGNRLMGERYAAIVESGRIPG